MVGVGIGERLRQAIQSKNKTFKDFSDESAIPYITLQQYLANKRKPGADALIKINIHLNISVDWLLTGKGPMHPAPRAPPHSPTHTPSPKKIALDLLNEAVENLNEDQKRELLERIREMQRMNELEKKVGEMDKKMREMEAKLKGKGEKVRDSPTKNG